LVTGGLFSKGRREREREREREKRVERERKDQQGFRLAFLARKEKKEDPLGELLEGKTPGAIALTTMCLRAREAARILVRWLAAALEAASVSGEVADPVRLRRR